MTYSLDGERVFGGREKWLQARNRASSDPTLDYENHWETAETLICGYLIENQ